MILRRGELFRPIGGLPESLNQAILVEIILLGRLGVSRFCLSLLCMPVQAPHIVQSKCSSKQASERASERASEQTSKQARKQYYVHIYIYIHIYAYTDIHI